jgi:ATP-binding cassette, subfamily B, bacterial PglK
MQTILKLLKLFTPAERRRLIPIMIAILVMSALEVAGIGSLGPFVAVVADPTVIHRQPLLARAYELGGFSTDRGFLIALGAGVFAMITIATVFKMVVQYAVIKYVDNRRYTLGLRLFRQYLYQPYSYFLDHNTSELSKNILAEVNQVVNGVMRPMMQVFSRVVRIQRLVTA